MKRAKGFTTPPTNVSAFITGAGLGNFVYVAKNGSDTTGTRNSLALPFLTIAAALAASSAGDTIYLAPGTYTENVTWLANRSLLGSGSRQSLIVGTFSFQPTGTGNVAMNMADVYVYGVGEMMCTGKTAGDVLVEIRDCRFDSAWTFTADNTGLYEIAIYSTRCGSTMRFDYFQNISCWACNFGNFTFNAWNGGEQIKLQACVIPVVTLNGASSHARLAGCEIASALTFTDNFGGTLHTTGCEMRTAAIRIEAGTWYEYGCTFVQSNVGGASGNKRVSFQRVGSANCTGGSDTVITLPIPLGATDYHVSATPLTATAAPPIYYVHTKTATAFTVRLVSANDEQFEFGIFYRVA